VGPYLQYAKAKKGVSTYDVLEDEDCLCPAFPMTGSQGEHGLILTPNRRVPGVTQRQYDREDSDCASPIDPKEVTRAVVKFRKEFAKEIAALDAAHGTKGEVHFGVVVSWS